MRPADFEAMLNGPASALATVKSAKDAGAPASFRCIGTFAPRYGNPYNDADFDESGSASASCLDTVAALLTRSDEIEIGGDVYAVMFIRKGDFSNERVLTLQYL